MHLKTLKIIENDFGERKKRNLDLCDDKDGSTEAILLPWRALAFGKFPLISWVTYTYSLDTVGNCHLAVLSLHKQTFGQEPRFDS